MELLLRAFPDAVGVKGYNHETPLDKALGRVEKKADNTMPLLTSDPIITLLEAGGVKGIII